MTAPRTCIALQSPIVPGLRHGENDSVEWPGYHGIGRVRDAVACGWWNSTACACGRSRAEQSDEYRAKGWSELKRVQYDEMYPGTRYLPKGDATTLYYNLACLVKMAGSELSTHAVGIPGRLVEQ